ncbi:MAG: sugar phosphate nucleotidyltransferase [Candidatus Caldarchaeum sp.]|nr:sugar phosphate nucleotidyltransferase [Candidatus Caldarchaeum sp.]
MVLAAGYGKRLKPLTVNRPKHVLPLAGKPLIQMIVESLGHAGVQEVGVLVGYHGEKVQDALKPVTQPRITFIRQKQLLGTGAALKECRDYLAGEEFFCVVYGDVTISTDVIIALQKMVEDGVYDGVLAAVESEETGRFGVVETKDDRLVRIGEKEMKAGPVNAGIYILNKKVFEVLDRTGLSPRGEIELTDALNKYVLEGGVIGVKFFGKGWWFDIGNPSDYLKANTVYLAKFFDRVVCAEKNVSFGNDVVVSGPLYIGPNVSIGRDSVIEGPSMICSGSVVGDGSVVSNSVIMENCYVGKKSLVRRSVICEDSLFVEGLEVLSNGFPAFVCDPGFKSEKRLKVV